MRISCLLTLVGTLLLTGCSSLMQPVDNPVVQPSPTDQAQVVFMRSAFTGKAIDASLYDVTDGQTRFVGILSNATKIAYPVAPGHRVFMVVSEAADFLEADLVAGKTYYALVTPRMGMWKARFSLWPVSRDPKAEYSLQSSDFKDWISDTQLVTNSPKSLTWFQQHKADVESKRVEYWPVWKQKSPADLQLRTLKATDGQ
ncbi:hypothetical protein EGJ27_12475 [Pseudomonas sp. v388]|uniref:hypothetical protein n=1 Tax=Pseudomonas sp. v388 TaxID=2479849 RepID=UPI000F785AF0|nr:hypothetical protein [Pseudomonas sp. v388]RRV07486.1 hypothetical protein EGJ27_12475 [Pseudomonas sp. v388]